jgi:hypothetical protein
MTYKEILDNYFKEKQLGEKGGYYSPFYKADFWGVILVLPNFKGRKRALMRHDIHHIITGYEVDLYGEFEIGAWEIASGCSNYFGVFLLNLIAIPPGMIFIPKRTIHAFYSGRRSKNLYQSKLTDDDLMQMSKTEVFECTHFHTGAVRYTFWDSVLFIGWLLVSIFVSLLLAPIMLVILMAQVFRVFK